MDAYRGAEVLPSAVVKARTKMPEEFELMPHGRGGALHREDEGADGIGDEQGRREDRLYDFTSSSLGAQIREAKVLSRLVR